MIIVSQEKDATSNHEGYGYIANIVYEMPES